MFVTAEALPISNRSMADSARDLGVFRPVSRPGLLSEAAERAWLARESPISAAFATPLGSPMISTWSVVTSGLRSPSASEADLRSRASPTLSRTASAHASGLNSPKKLSQRRKLEQLDRRLSHNFREANIRSPVRQCASRIVEQTSPSKLAQRENFKKDVYSNQIDKGLLGNASTTAARGLLESLDSSQTDKEMARLEQTFNAHMAGINDIIGGIAARTGNSGDDFVDSKKNAERERERKIREEALRRARKKEQAARDPHRKVRLKIENRKNFEFDAELDGNNNGEAEKKKDDSIPMMQLDFNGGSGVRERVAMVDIRLMRSRCIGLNESSSLPEILELHKHKERQARFDASLSLQSCTSAPVLGRADTTNPQAPVFLSAMMKAPSPEDHGLRHVLHHSLMRHRKAMEDAEQNFGGKFTQKCWEDRRRHANENKHHRHIDQLLVKLNAMRSVLPDTLPHGLEVINQEVTAYKAATGSSCNLSLGCGIDMTREIAAALASSEVMGSAPGSHGQRKNRRMAVEIEKTPVTEAIRRRTRTRWKVVRGVVNFLVCFFLQKKRHAAVDKIKLLLHQIGEWSRVKSLAQKTIGNIKFLQRACRDCLALKRKRCDEMAKHWIRTEDRELAHFFKEYAKNLVDESKDLARDAAMSSTSKKGRPMPLVAKSKREQHLDIASVLEQNGVNSEQFVASSLDWKSMRIPAWKRREMIGWYYMRKLKQHVQDRKSMLSAVQTAVRNHKEMNVFLREFGAEESHQVEFGQVARDVHDHSATKPRFWEIHHDDNIVLELIARCAHDLKGEVPFQLHPANMGQTGDEPRSTKSKQKSVFKGKGGASLGIRSLRGGAPSGGVPMGLLTRREPEESGSGSAREEEPLVDVDQVADALEGMPDAIAQSELEEKDASHVPKLDDVESYVFQASW